MTESRTQYEVQHATSTGRWVSCAWNPYPPHRFDDACAKAIELADREGKPHRVALVVSTVSVEFTCDHRSVRVLVPPAGYCDRGPCILNQGHEGKCTT